MAKEYDHILRLARALLRDLGGFEISQHMEFSQKLRPRMCELHQVTSRSTAPTDNIIFQHYTEHSAIWCMSCKPHFIGMSRIQKIYGIYPSKYNIIPSY